MRDLFFSELNRYKAYAKTAAFIFLALLAYLSSQGDLMAGRGMFSTVLSGLAIILPLIFSRIMIFNAPCIRKKGARVLTANI